jgi:hypothetical protein
MLALGPRTAGTASCTSIRAIQSNRQHQHRRYQEDSAKICVERHRLCVGVTVRRRLLQHEIIRAKAVSTLDADGILRE